jgi:hypothetical protein
MAMLTKFEGAKFEGQTVYLTGQAFIRCEFQRCTLVYAGNAFHLESCSIIECNLDLRCILMWGAEANTAEVDQLVQFFKGAQAQASQPAPLGDLAIGQAALDASLAKKAIEPPRLRGVDPPGGNGHPIPDRIGQEPPSPKLHPGFPLP